MTPRPMPAGSARTQPSGEARPPGYRFGRRLRTGWMTEVFLATLAEAQRPGREVAVKRVLRGCVGEPLLESSFAREARLAALLSHPNIVSVLGVDRDRDGTLELVMEYVDGPTLAALARTGPLPVPAAIHVASEMLSGLGYAHEAQIPGCGRGVVHGDVSPENVLLSLDGSVKLADFGSARTPSGPFAHALTVLKTATASYASPEQLAERDLDGRTDLFAVGAVLWELLAGQPLFENMTPREVAARVNFSTLPRPGLLRPGVPTDLEDVVMRLLARTREARYQTTGAATLDLARCADAPRDGRRELAQLIAGRMPPASADGRERFMGLAGDGHVAPVSALAAASGVRSDAPSPWRHVPRVLLDSPTREPRTFSEGEYLALVDALDRSPSRSRNLALAHVLYHCKLSMQTAVGIDIEQLDLKASAFLHVKLPGSDERRTVPFNDVVRDALERYVLHRRAHIGPGDSRALFLWDRGTRMPVEVVREIMRSGDRRK